MQIEIHRIALSIQTERHRDRPAFTRATLPIREWVARRLRPGIGGVLINTGWSPCSHQCQGAEKAWQKPQQNLRDVRSLPRPTDRSRRSPVRDAFHLRPAWRMRRAANDRDRHLY